MLDYDGTLTAHHRLPDFAHPSASVLKLLSELVQLPQTVVYILSGRRCEHLDGWFGDAGVGLVAEYGCFVKHPQLIEDMLKQQENDFISGKEMKNGWRSLATQADLSWKDTIRPLLQHFTARTPGSSLEEKEVVITWHYRNADPEFGAWQARELQMSLDKIISHMPVSVSTKSV